MEHTLALIEKAHEGDKAARDELVKENLPLAVGPSFGHASKFEMHNKC